MSTDQHTTEPLHIDGLPAAVSHYANAVRAGDFVFISGLTGMDADGQIVGRGDVVKQTRQVFYNIRLVLDHVGASPSDIARVTVYLRDAEHRPLINPVRQEFFGDHLPASTLVQVSRLFDADLLVEIEAIVHAPQR